MTDQLSRSAEESDGVDPTWVRLEDQLGWRTSSAGTTTRVLPPSRHTRGSSSLSSSSAPRPVVAGPQAPAAVTAFLAFLAVVVAAEGTQKRCRGRQGVAMNARRPTSRSPRPGSLQQIDEVRGCVSPVGLW